MTVYNMYVEVHYTVKKTESNFFLGFPNGTGKGEKTYKIADNFSEILNRVCFYLYESRHFMLYESRHFMRIMRRIYMKAWIFYYLCL